MQAAGVSPLGNQLHGSELGPVAGQWKPKLLDRLREALAFPAVSASHGIGHLPHVLHTQPRLQDNRSSRLFGGLGECIDTHRWVK